LCSGLVGADSKRLATYAPAKHDSFRNQTFIADQTTCLVTADETFFAESSTCIYAAESDQATFFLAADETFFAD